MHHEHLNPVAAERLQAILQEDPALINQALLHLLERCPECRRRCEDLSRWQRSGGQDGGDFNRWDYLLARSARQAEDLWQEVRAQDETALQLLASQERFATFGFLERLSEESRRIAGENPHRALALAELAGKLVVHLDPGEFGSDCWQELHMLIQASRGNAWRVLDDLPRAEEALDEAEVSWTRVRGPYLGHRARVLSLRVSLEIALRHLDRAVALAAEALDQVATHRPDHQVLSATLHLQQATALSYQGRLQKAVQALEQADALVTPEEEPRLWFAVQHNRLDILARQGCHREALALLPRVEALCERYSTPLNRDHFLWLKARITRDQGHLEASEALFFRVRRSFLEHQRPLFVAVVTLDLARTLIAKNDFAQVRQLAAECIPILKEQGVETEVLAAMALVEEAAAAEQLSEALLGSLQDYLEGNEDQPNGAVA